VNRPNKVIILGQPFTIKYEPSSKMQGLFGDTDVDSHVIRINKSLPEHSIQSTLFHEFLHAALAVAGISYVISDNIEEAIVRCLENALVPHIRLTVGEE
jgi:hypothetical protein